MADSQKVTMNKDLDLGAWLVSKIFSSVLFGVLTVQVRVSFYDVLVSFLIAEHVVQCAFYWDRYKHDQWGFKALVSSFIISDYDKITHVSSRSLQYGRPRQNLPHRIASNA